MNILEHMETVFDPSDADRAMRLAYKAISLCRLASRALDAENANQKMGRDLSGELFVAILGILSTLGLLREMPRTEEVNAVFAELTHVADIF